MISPADPFMMVDALGAAKTPLEVDALFAAAQERGAEFVAVVADIFEGFAESRLSDMREDIERSMPSLRGLDANRGGLGDISDRDDKLNLFKVEFQIYRHVADIKGAEASPFIQALAQELDAMPAEAQNSFVA